MNNPSVEPPGRGYPQEVVFVHLGRTSNGPNCWVLEKHSRMAENLLKKPRKRLLPFQKALFIKQKI